MSCLNQTHQYWSAAQNYSRFFFAYLQFMWNAYKTQRSHGQIIFRPQKYLCSQLIADIIMFSEVFNAYSCHCIFYVL